MGQHSSAIADINAAVGFTFDHKTSLWEQMGKSVESMDQDLSSFSLLTWNVWFDKKKQTERANEVFKEVEKLSPDFICFQETTKIFLSLVASNQFIRNTYSISDINGETFTSYGVVFLWKKNIPVTAIDFFPLPTRMSRKLLISTISLINGSNVII